LSTVRFVDKDTLYSSERSTAQEVNYPVATVVYAVSTELPVKLPKNVLLYTTDTRELYIGTGDKLVRVNIGSDGAVVSLADYLTEAQLGNTYTKLERFNPVKDQVDALNVQLGRLQDSISTVNIKLDNKVDDDDIFTVREMQNTFVKNEQFINGLDNKVNVRVNDQGNESYHVNTKDGSVIQFINGQTKITSKVSVQKDNVTLQALNNSNLGSRLFVKQTGIFYTEDQETPKEKDRLATQDDIDKLQNMYSDLVSRVEGIEIQHGQVKAQTDSFELNLARMIASLEAASADATEIRDIATRADNLASVTNNNYIDLYNTVGSLNSAVQNISSTAQAAYTDANWSSDAIAQYRLENDARVTTLEQSLDRYMGAQVIYSVIDNPAAKVITNIVPGYYVNNPVNILEVPYGTKDIASKIAAVDADNVLVAAVTESDMPLTVPAGISWDFTMYNPTNYQTAVVYAGNIKETADLKLPVGSTLRPQIVIKVKAPDNILPVDIADNGWIEYFVMPINCYMVRDFASSFIQKSIGSEELMGIDQNGEPVIRTVRLDLVGALNERDETQENPVLKTYTDLTDTTDVLDSKFISKYPEGLEVPVRLNNEDTFDEYETECYHAGAFISNGAFWYNQDSDCLVFDNRSPVNLVYKIYTISPSSEGGA